MDDLSKSISKIEKGESGGYTVYGNGRGIWLFVGRNECDYYLIATTRTGNFISKGKYYTPHDSAYWAMHVLLNKN